MANHKNKQGAPQPTQPSPTPPQPDHGFDESHGYGPGHGGPSGPGDAPGDETDHGAAKKIPTAEEDEALPTEE
jgi:hypothetical protein